MKKMMALLLVLAMMLSLAACGKKNEEQPEKETASSGSQIQVTEPEETEAPVASGEITMDALMAAPESPVEDFEVVDYGDAGVYLEGYLGDDEIVVIPESLGITHINKYVFANNCSAKAVRLSNSVQVLEEGSFGLNNNLQLFVCGSGLQKIEASVFQNCENLMEIVLNEGLVSLGKFSLSGSDHLMSVEMPSTATEIDPTAFYYIVEGFTIIGEAGSYAEQYAAELGIPFKAK